MFGFTAWREASSSGRGIPRLVEPFGRDASPSMVRCGPARTSMSGRSAHAPHPALAFRISVEAPSIRCYRIAARSCFAREPAATSCRGVRHGVAHPCSNLCANHASQATPTLVASSLGARAPSRESGVPPRLPFGRSFNCLQHGKLAGSAVPQVHPAPKVSGL
jgi:hypothetical protein